jgi:hypothetical protein
VIVAVVKKRGMTAIANNASERNTVNLQRFSPACGVDNSYRFLPKKAA